MLNAFSLLLLISIIAIAIIIITEITGHKVKLFEGFSDISYWASFISPRSDIGKAKEAEEEGYTRDPRYFNDYVDVTRIGVPYDFCRMLVKNSDPDNLFFACALAGTENLDSVKFRTAGTKDGFRVSYDDYMRDVNGDGRSDYCRVLPWNDGSYQPVCSYSSDIGFDSAEKVDGNPPDDIAKLLEFYRGCVMWLRFHNDMLDYVKRVKVNIAGSLQIDEVYSKDRSSVNGLQFNGSQFLRIGDANAADLSVGTLLPLRSIRAWMVWVYFDEFTNNAKIFDFGNGAGNDNVFLGILGKGESTVDDSPLRGDESTVPTNVPGAGAQPVVEMSPKRLMETTDANVNEYICDDFELKNDKATHAFLPQVISTRSKKAALLFEVWDKKSRKMRIKVNAAIPLKKWTHITITTTNNDAFRPDIAVYIDAKQVYEKKGGWLAATSSMTNCYIGKSNWSAPTQYENRDELFKGRIFDFRAYNISLDESVIEDSFNWSKDRLA
jgi:hypothetical protein